MKGLLSLIIGGLSFMLITGAQINAFLASNAVLIIDENSFLPTVVFVHWSIKMIALSISLIALSFSINYSRSGKQKMNVANRVGRYLALLAILLSIFPVYQVFLK
ncbi:MAG TPA: hypothetical protein DGP89_00475 [Saprospirales bacterium]|jgi:hypothetical protein|nr:hypothetical protein [Saprospirales bacterium]HCV49791.1 hypothetical protein [Saprospirales bacterium]|tara:strand:- start:3063 stop:3377 length:315 start_codon:yes stop_codon:yes gene_type:complete